MNTFVSRLGLVLLALVSPAALAHDALLMKALSAIDTVPNAAELARAVPNAEQALVAVANDETVAAYPRERAVSFLSMFPSRATAVELERIAANSPAPRLRWTAAYTRIRAFAGQADTLVFATRWLDRAEANDRDAAVRGLRWVAGSEAAALLASAAKRETDRAVQAAIRHVQEARRAAGR